MTRIPNDPRFRQGEPLKLEELRRMHDLAQRTDRVSAAGGMGADIGAGGVAIFDQRPLELWIQLVDRGGGSEGEPPTYHYSWQAMRQTADGTDFEVDDQGPAGTTADFPAIEVNDNGDIDVTGGGQPIVRAWLGDTGGCLLFEYAAAGEGGGGSTVNVKGGTGAVSAFAADVLDFDPSYVTVSHVPTGEANVNVAVASSASGGVLTAAAQHIAGEKTFDDRLYATFGLEAGNVRRIETGEADTTGANDSIAGPRTIPVVSGFATNTLFDGCGWGFDDITNRIYFVDVNNGDALAYFSFSPGTSVGSSEYVCLNTGSTNDHSGTVKLVGGSTVLFDIARYNNTGHTGNAAYAINGTAGVSGTAPDGGVYTGGICTTLPTTGGGEGPEGPPGPNEVTTATETDLDGILRGDGDNVGTVTVGSGLDYTAGVLSATGGGGYTDEEAQDAVGGILTDSSEIDFTYNDGTPSITASLKDNSVSPSRLQNPGGAGLMARTSASAGPWQFLTANNDFEIPFRQANDTLAFGFPRPNSITSVGARAFRNSGSVAVNNATHTVITLNSESFDTDSLHDNSSNSERLTIPTGMGGTWLLIIECVPIYDTLGVSLSQAQLRANGTPFATVPIWAATQATIVSVIVSVSAGAFLDATLRQDSGNNWNFPGAGGYLALTAIYLGR